MNKEKKAEYEAREHSDGSHWFVDKIEAGESFTMADELTELEAVKLSEHLSFIDEMNKEKENGTFYECEVCKDEKHFNYDRNIICIHCLLKFKRQKAENEELKFKVASAEECESHERMRKNEALDRVRELKEEKARALKVADSILAKDKTFNKAEGGE